MCVKLFTFDHNHTKEFLVFLFNVWTLISSLAYEIDSEDKTHKKEKMAAKRRSEQTETSQENIEELEGGQMGQENRPESRQ